MTRALNRSISFWILLAVSIALIASGALVVLDHLGTMTATLKDGSATGLEVYAGQSWIVIGAALIGAGALGVLLALALAVVAGLLRAPDGATPATAPEITEDPAAGMDSTEAPETEAEPSGSLEQSTSDVEEEDQNGSSGSTATATKISVR
jgi:hypothetical protein